MSYTSYHSLSAQTPETRPVVRLHCELYQLAHCELYRLSLIICPNIRSKRRRYVTCYIVSYTSYHSLSAQTPETRPVATLHCGLHQLSLIICPDTRNKTRRFVTLWVTPVITHYLPRHMKQDLSLRYTVGYTSYHSLASQTPEHYDVHR